LRTVYLAPEMLAATAPCVVLAASPLAREMLCYATHWGPSHEPSPASQHFFLALAALCAEWSATPLPLSLPAAESPEVERAMRYALDHLDRDISLADAARAAGTSTRTLSRRFSAEAKQSWKAFVHQARMLRAMELLARPRASVSAVSAAVGFDSLSAFSRAFSAFAGESPKDYQGRALRGAAQHTSQKTKNTLQSRQPKDA
jgi:AraC-like DNA-binding protein